MTSEIRSWWDAMRHSVEPKRYRYEWYTLRQSGHIRQKTGIPIYIEKDRVCCLVERRSISRNVRCRKRVKDILAEIHASGEKTPKFVFPLTRSKTDRYKPDFPYTHLVFMDPTRISYNSRDGSKYILMTDPLSIDRITPKDSLQQSIHSRQDQQIGILRLLLFTQEEI